MYATVLEGSYIDEFRPVDSRSYCSSPMLESGFSYQMGVLETQSLRTRETLEGSLHIQCDCVVFWIRNLGLRMLLPREFLIWSRLGF